MNTDIKTIIRVIHEEDFFVKVFTPEHSKWIQP